ncbi:hypothetical protein D8B26_003486 [Coccidioides posadasii str. Silveira]|uniref:Uncharacterized protein n=3 Tax=Coccidioides posadasii TaxID=199306 RepID=E9D147_COCPS|nr:hypothetical protein CPC735_003430 [Coccidioides posadasii C735 delta SOWgp]EER26174.1 hypothetical protein CPC735_003430 [Coccidioides posadasii C735 delta SOWgp]EFW20051.1 conserved hypothetical protein [Coccidioides posadasii str. Silveira]KMM73382.1 hypothetical protein CPAG_09671 [Coccidioides posadasii RMSCC 3488]QVM08811.1 hypothetical protein D8B26_003486 [Coccidioides posadasii str. Silveira]|eukprot:XP_003068319.1 hypothetical protein CPC735_003430 [Coccidioides posadasii C735 delta SOWgp]
MRVTAVLRQAAAARTPLIKFVGKRATPAAVDSTPRVHPASPTNELPDSFMKYRSRAQQHGPLNSPSRPSAYGGYIGGHSGASLGSVQPKQGEYFDRNDLPERFRRIPWSQAEIEAIETGGASLFA